MDFKNERLMMSKEETRKRAKELLNENQVDLITKYMFLEQQCKKQKEVIDEVRKFIEDWLFDAGGNGASMTYEDINELLQILDKVIGDDK